MVALGGPGIDEEAVVETVDDEAGGAAVFVEATLLVRPGARVPAAGAGAERLRTLKIPMGQKVSGWAAAHRRALATWPPAAPSPP